MCIKLCIRSTSISVPLLFSESTIILTRTSFWCKLPAPLGQSLPSSTVFYYPLPWRLRHLSTFLLRLCDVRNAIRYTPNKSLNLSGFKAGNLPSLRLCTIVLQLYLTQGRVLKHQNPCYNRSPALKSYAKPRTLADAVLDPFRT